uniref:Uncharacterized protein n=1 Tax=Oryza brachyantha TaxID=4533 RepID=J3LCJ6_ORYBR
MAHLLLLRSPSSLKGRKVIAIEVVAFAVTTFSYRLPLPRLPPLALPTAQLLSSIQQQQGSSLFI